MQSYHLSPKKSTPLDDYPSPAIHAAAKLARNIRAAGGVYNFCAGTNEACAAAILHSIGAAQIVRDPFGQWMIIGTPFHRGAAGKIFRHLISSGGEVGLWERDIEKLGVGVAEAMAAIANLESACLIRSEGHDGYLHLWTTLDEGSAI